MNTLDELELCTELLFYLIGNSYQIKSPPGRIALRRIGIMSQKRPAAGGESCEQDSFLLYRKVLVWRTLDMKRARTEAGMTSR